MRLVETAVIIRGIISIGIIIVMVVIIRRLHRLIIPLKTGVRIKV
jgi:hypothetical protein